MKILQIAPAWIDTPPKMYGGTEWVIYNLIKGLVGFNQQVTLFATKNSHTYANLKYIFEKSFTDLDIPWFNALPSLIHYHQAFKLSEEFDIVHAHLSSATDLILLPFLSDLTNKKIPNILTIHSHFPFDIFSDMDEYYLKLYAPQVLAVSISKFMQTRLPKQFQDVGFVHNSLDTDTLIFNKNKGTYLTWLGKIIPEKGLHDAILVAKSLNEQLVFAGIVDKFQEKSGKYYEEKIKPYIDGKQIIYLGPADLKMKNKMLGGAKGFLNPINWDEPFGMVTVESMACGTPVISFDRGAASELVIDGKTGFLVKNRQQMIEAVKNISKIDRLACRKHVEKNFSPQIAARQYLNIYENGIKLIKKF